jgi:uncharacterized DUF497 family protein
MLFVPTRYLADFYCMHVKNNATNERRFITLGLLEGTPVIVVHTETEDEIRVISLRKAVKNEQKLYFTNV